MAAADPDNPRRRPKGDKRVRTRTALLEAARELTREKGYEHTTLADIARRAGMTTGAIYGNFRNREELFIALSEAYWPPVVPSVAPGAGFSEILRSLAEATIEAMPDREAAAIGFLTGRAHALKNDAVRQQAQSAMEESYAVGAAWLGDAVVDEELPYSPEIMVRVIHALTDGLVLQRLLAPELVGDDVFRAAFELLAAGKGDSGRPKRKAARQQ